MTFFRPKVERDQKDTVTEAVAVYLHPLHNRALIVAERFKSVGCNNLNSNTQNSSSVEFDCYAILSYFA